MAVAYTSQHTRVLVVDDDEALLDHVRTGLMEEGYEVRTAARADAALKLLDQFRPDAVVLDVALPDDFLRTGVRADGISVLRTIRERQGDVAVLMLSATAFPSLKVLALDMGADDYLTKPHDMKELAARLRAVLRRKQGRNRLAPLQFGEVAIDPEARRVTRSGQPLDLTPIEYGLLYALASRANRVLSRTQLIELVWRMPFVGDERIVDTHIASMRKKLESGDGGRKYIVTVRGAGYLFEWNE